MATPAGVLRGKQKNRDRLSQQGETGGRVGLGITSKNKINQKIKKSKKNQKEKARKTHRARPLIPQHLRTQSPPLPLPMPDSRQERRGIESA
jgi:hypothetical protein